MRHRKKKKPGTVQVHVTLAVPRILIPEGTKDPAKVLAALITAPLWEMRISVEYVSQRDARKFTQGGVK